jgi:S-adenosylmethionine/arginine decarboxylase-like enzyme
MLNARACLGSTIRSKQQIHDFTTTLVKKIDMVPYGPPQIVMFGTGNKQGYTLVQLIETSNICAHFVEETDDMYLDVFSCKNFNPEVVRKIVADSFQPTSIDTKMVLRDAGHQMS